MKKILTLHLIIAIGILLSACAIIDHAVRHQVTNPLVIALNGEALIGCGFYYRGYLITAAHIRTKEELFSNEEMDVTLVSKTDKAGLHRAIKMPLFGDVVIGFMRQTWVKDSDVVIKVPGLFVGKDLLVMEGDNVERWLVSINTYRGFSGSPVLDMNGRLLGIGTQYYAVMASQYTGLAPGSVLISLVGVNDIDKMIDQYEKGRR